MQNITAGKTQGNTGSDTLKFEQVFLKGLMGNIPEALVFLDTIDASTLTERQQKIKQQYYARFRTKDEVYTYKTGNALIRELINIYINYWQKALIDNNSIENYDNELADSAAEFLNKNYSIVSNKPIHDVKDNFPQYMQEYLKTKGLYAATGKTGMFYDLLIHAKETEVFYDVTTPEDTIKVKVVFMEDIISNGWEEYATFGKYYPGGWATTDALFCVKESYDLESEKFLVSYLKHEGKHFADYKLFPKLGGTDLEYRAKLVELSSAKESLFNLIKFFSKNARYDKQNPHGFANFCVIRDLSRLAFSEDIVTDMKKWEEISPDVINGYAVSLLKKNTAELKKAGAEIITDYIK